MVILSLIFKRAWQAQFLHHALVHKTKNVYFFQDVQMILLPYFDIPYDFGLGKIPCDLPFQGPVFFGVSCLSFCKEDNIFHCLFTFSSSFVHLNHYFNLTFVHSSHFQNCFITFTTLSDVLATLSKAKPSYM